MAGSVTTAGSRDWLVCQGVWETIIAGLPGCVIMRHQGCIGLIQISLHGREERGFLMRTQAFVLVLIVIAASEPARLFRAIVNGIVALLQHIKLL